MREIRPAVVLIVALTLITGPSPFATCTAGQLPGSLNYVDAEVEPWVDVNPTNPTNIVAVWQQISVGRDRQSGGQDKYR